jgi:hypothetical protein
VSISSPGTANVRVGGGRPVFVGLAAAAVFVIAGVALIAAPHAGLGQKSLGVLEIALFGPFPLYWSIRLLRAGCIYVLAPDGIRSPLYGWPLVPWSDVQGTRIVERRGRRYLAIDIRAVDARLRQMKSGSRAVRRNLRYDLGFISIPEQYAPASLEGLQAEIERRRVPQEPSSAPAASSSTGTSILPMSRARAAAPVREVSPQSTRTLRSIAAGHALVLVLAVLAHHATQTPHEVVLGIAAALLLGAFAAQFEAVIVGLVTILAAEALLIVVDLTVGHHIALATRILYLFFPLCVLVVASTAWPRRPLSHH